jgi:hypothetical protein
MFGAVKRKYIMTTLLSTNVILMNLVYPSTAPKVKGLPFSSIRIEYSPARRTPCARPIAIFDCEHAEHANAERNRHSRRTGRGHGSATNETKHARDTSEFRTLLSAGAAWTASGKDAAAPSLKGAPR